MYAYRTPGVYFEWRDLSVRVPARLRTDIAGFVGIAQRGELHSPQRVESWTQFVSTFGGYIPQAYLAYAVAGFFANGGRTCWVVRVADPLGARAGDLTLVDDTGSATLTLRATSPGVWADQLTATVLRNNPQSFSLTLRHADGGQEIWTYLSMDSSDTRYAPRILNDSMSGSAWVRATAMGAAGRPPRAGSWHLSGGADGLATLKSGHLSGEGAPAGACWGLACLERVDEVGIVAIPDILPKSLVVPKYRPETTDCRVYPPLPLVPGAVPAPPEYPPAFPPDTIADLQAALVLHCERAADRFAILDMPATERDPQGALAWRRRFDTSYAALYHPWLVVPDPLKLEATVRALPPSGHVAGLYARGDRQTGVHRPPANLVLQEVQAAAIPLDDVLHGVLNDAQINVIRAISGRGIRVSGARTLSSDASLRYVNVRRLLMMLRESVDEGAQDLVFEPNNPDLWRNIERAIGALLDRMWRDGMLDGATAEAAYHVRCDAQTNPPDQTETGRVTCEIGVQPPWPAEFVVVRIGFTESGATALEVI